MTSQQAVIDQLPAHLQPFVAVQDYANYTPRDHAIWRFLLHQLRFSLRHSAHPTYFEGLTKTGIGTEAIPRIEEINSCLTKLGWQAVAVDGFLPPAVFMEFQARKILAIALNIRSFEHMLYTPAPDIIHESAGHAPFLVDIDYAEFLQRFGELGMQAIANQHDMNIYEAVRQLSIVKEDGSSAAQDIDAAQSAVEALQDMHVAPSEANLLARLHWWTVEYGLVGSINNYTIYGAGLLSSLSESQSCMDDRKVTKLPLTLNALKTAYDITAPQPQLFVTESCRHLSQVLEEYGRHMCCQRGGASALEEALEAATVTTSELNSGLQIAGKISRVVTDPVGNAVYLNTQGPTQLAYQHTELPGHGIEYHELGFGSPIGRLRAMERCLSNYTVDELKRHHIEIDTDVTLNFLSGICVSGRLVAILRRNQRNLLFTFEQCTVSDIDGEVLFDPEWGVYDMAVGDAVISVAGGSADQSAYPMYDAPSTQVSAASRVDGQTQAQFTWYSKLRKCRESGSVDSTLIQEITAQESLDWLIKFEAFELSNDKALRNQLEEISTHAGDDVAVLINGGLKRLSEPS
ncbi:aromatic amino acid hydroxylase [Arenicella xantha]|uniref:Phenylalanine-4-hydroxylase n=1 Tax=Arenicella xantha TaxID=644221 RepID=A0A395JQH5_9GAMM|nr:aromatic amino acid hydroxylase [Arenicella xantha]RBP53797.1 phenylalanine-4-hydroxylase [Arenicella xantha]